MNIECFVKNWRNISPKDISFSKDEWCEISKYKYLEEEDFIEEYKDRVDWFFISEYQRLSEKFIEKHKDKVNWSFISEY